MRFRFNTPVNYPFALMGWFDFMSQEARLDNRVKRLKKENSILKKQNSVRDLEEENDILRAKLETPRTAGKSKTDLIEDVIQELERRKSPPQGHT